MGAQVEFRCPVEDCRYRTYLRLGMGEEADNDAHDERLRMLRNEHPNHPKDGHDMHSR